ncbi:hypothetical protein [Bradyrhizobium sp. AZCC 2289]|uniref:hypothetical protein n=1 Tax=Bradyrhizobium sp. AZCC 2289 TaxID=3117026 RepID=UPI002FEFC57E
MLFGEETSTREFFRLLWKGKYRILSCAFIAAIVGVVVAIAIPKVYETKVVARPASEAAFGSFSEILSHTPGDWHLTKNMVATTKQTFLTFARDRDYLGTYVLSHQDLFPQAKLDDPETLQKIVYQRYDVIISKDASDDALEFRFRYGNGTFGAQFLNNFVKTVIDKTTESLYANGRSSLAAAKKSKENELERLREFRDIAAKQLMLTYREALDAAKSANIEKPVALNLWTVSPLAATNGQPPLFLFGSQILTSELRNIEQRMGNDFAIPEFGLIRSSIADLDRRLNVLDQTLGTPIVITQLGYEARPIFPAKTPIMLICVAIGAALGGCWEYARLQKSKPQADLPTSISSSEN